MNLELTSLLLAGLREVVGHDKEAGVAIVDLAKRICDRELARERKKKDLPSLGGFCAACSDREYRERLAKEQQRLLGLKGKKAARQRREIRRLLRGKR